MLLWIDASDRREPERPRRSKEGRRQQGQIKNNKCKQDTKTILQRSSGTRRTHSQFSTTRGPTRLGQRAPFLLTRQAACPAHSGTANVCPTHTTSTDARLRKSPPEHAGGAALDVYDPAYHNIRLHDCQSGDRGRTMQPTVVIPSTEWNLPVRIYWDRN